MCHCSNLYHVYNNNYNNNYFSYSYLNLILFSATVCIRTFSQMSFSHAYVYWFRCQMYLSVCICVYIEVRLCCACIICLTHNDVIAGLLVNSPMYVLVQLLFYSFRVIIMIIQPEQTDTQSTESQNQNFIYLHHEYVSILFSFLNNHS